MQVKHKKLVSHGSTARFFQYFLTWVRNVSRNFIKMKCFLRCCQFFKLCISFDLYPFRSADGRLPSLLSQLQRTLIVYGILFIKNTKIHDYQSYTNLVLVRLKNSSRTRVPYTFFNLQCSAKSTTSLFQAGFEFRCFQFLSFGVWLRNYN